MKKYYEILISATSKEEAESLLELLLNDKLVAGGFITSGQSRHWWNKKIDREQYFTISCFTVDQNKDKVIEVVEKNSRDEVPGVLFFEIDYGNKKFLNWIIENTK